MGAWRAPVRTRRAGRGPKARTGASEGLRQEGAGLGSRGPIPAPWLAEIMRSRLTSAMAWGSGFGWVWQATGVPQRVCPAHRPLLSSCSGGPWREHVHTVHPPTSTPSFLWPPAWSWRPWPWDFPSVLPGAVTHKTQGICPESPFFRPGLGAQTLWGQSSPEQLSALLCRKLSDERG